MPFALDQYLAALPMDPVLVRTPLDGLPVERHTLRSLQWRGHEWTHPLWIVRPEQPRVADHAVLYISGDEVPESDLPYVQRLAELTRLPVVALFGVPNQPIWDMREDDLIAHTFEQHLISGETDWPLLYPMVGAARAALAAAESLLGVSRFVVTGASKRGWTTWLLAATRDPRVAAIAPMVFDNLNMPSQMRAQLQHWGVYSDRLDDYSERALQTLAETEAGQRLVALVDPYADLPRIGVPKLILNGANDPYWTVDALTRYEGAMEWPWSACVVPNHGHAIGGEWMDAAMAAFAASVVRGETLPQVDLRLDGGEAVLDGAPTLRLWGAESPDLRFEFAEWKVIGEGDRVELPRWRGAVFAEGHFAGYSLTSSARVLWGA